MASGWTNRGKYNLLKTLQGTALPTNFYVALASTTPDEDDNTMADVTEPAGYARYSLSKNSTDFDVITETDGSTDRALIQIKNVAWTASGASLPTSAATYALLVDDTSGSGAEIWAFWYLGASGGRQVSDGQTLTLVDLELRLDEPS